MRSEILTYGETAVLAVLGDGAGPEATRRVCALVERLTGRGGGIETPIAGAATVLVPFDPLAVEASAVRTLVADAIAGLPDPPSPINAELLSPIELPTRYGGTDGPDLDEVARRHDLSTAGVIELHASTEYEVRFLGFAPGFAYLGTLAPALVTPRRATPRTRVPAGSVAIADDQTAVYPFASPGGWNLIGRTAVRVWDLDRDPPALLLPGRRVRFVPVE